MRSKSRRMLITLLAVMATAAVASASASAALPEFSVVGATFTTKAKFSTLETEGGAWKLSCSKGVTLNGEVTGPKTASVRLDLRECAAGGGWCLNKTEGTERILESVQMPATLQYVKVKTSRTVGLELNVAPEHQEAPFPYPLVASFGCPGVSPKLTGYLIGAISPINTKTKELTLAYHQKGGAQEIKWGEEIWPGSGQQLHWVQSGVETKAGLESEPVLQTSVEEEVRG